MEYRYLGTSGLQVSALSLGSWVTFGTQLGEDAVLACMEAAVSAGVNFFDSAESYAQGEAETLMGRAIKRAGWKRSDLVISTKIFWGGHGPNDRGLSRKHIIEGSDAALARLQLDYVDLVFCHRPDAATPLEETVRAMSHLVNSGRAFYWGTSEWSAERIREAHAIARREHLVPPTMEQPQYNMFHRDRVEREYQPLYDEIGLGTTVWSPLAGGLLTGKYNAGIPTGSRATLESLAWLRPQFEGEEAAGKIEKVRSMEPLAAELGCSLAQLALAWCLKNSHVSSVIVGASSIEQLQENLAAGDFVERIDADMQRRIEDLLDNRPASPTNFRTL